MCVFSTIVLSSCLLLVILDNSKLVGESHNLTWISPKMRQLTGNNLDASAS